MGSSSRARNPFELGAIKSSGGMSWELAGSQAFRRGDWKILRLPPPRGDGKWGLFNLAEDPAEMRDQE